MSSFQIYFTLFGLGGLSCILVGSPLFFIVEGSFTMYYSVVWRAQRDERFACLCSRAIPHYLVLGGRLCCILVSSPPFFIIKSSFTMYYSFFWRAQRDKRCVCPCSRYISHYLVLGFGRVLLYLSQFSTIFYHWRLVYNVFQCSVKGMKRREVHMSAFWSYSTLFGFGRVMLYLSQLSTIFYHWRLILNVFKCRLKELKRQVVRVTAFSKYSTLSAFGGGLCCISVSFPLFFIIEGSFTVLFKRPKNKTVICAAIPILSHTLHFYCSSTLKIYVTLCIYQVDSR